MSSFLKKLNAIPFVFGDRKVRRFLIEILQFTFYIGLYCNVNERKVQKSRFCYKQIADEISIDITTFFR